MHLVPMNVQLTSISYPDNSPLITTDRAGANRYWTKPSECNCTLVMGLCLQITGALWSVFGVDTLVWNVSGDEIPLFFALIPGRSMEQTDLWM